MEEIVLFFLSESPITGLLLLFVLTMGVVVGYLIWMRSKNAKVITDPCSSCKYKMKCDECTYKFLNDKLVNGIETTTTALGDQNIMIGALQKGNDYLLQQNTEIKAEVKEMKNAMVRITENLERSSRIQDEILLRLKLKDD